MEGACVFEHWINISWRQVPKDHILNSITGKYKKTFKVLSTFCGCSFNQKTGYTINKMVHFGRHLQICLGSQLIRLGIQITTAISYIKTLKTSNHMIKYNYPPKGRWIVVDIYRDAKRRGIYPPLFTDREGDSCFSIYQIRWIKKCCFNFFFWNFSRNDAPFFFPFAEQWIAKDIPSYGSQSKRAKIAIHWFGKY